MRPSNNLKAASCWRHIRAWPQHRRTALAPPATATAAPLHARTCCAPWPASARTWGQTAACPGGCGHAPAGPTGGPLTPQVTAGQRPGWQQPCVCECVDRQGKASWAACVGHEGQSHGTAQDTSRRKRQQEQGCNVMRLSRHTARRPQLGMLAKGLHCRSISAMGDTHGSRLCPICGPQLLDRMQDKKNKAAQCAPVSAPQLLHRKCHILEHLLAFGWLCVGLTKAHQGRQQLARVQHRACRTRPSRNQGITLTCCTMSRDG